MNFWAGGSGGDEGETHVFEHIIYDVVWWLRYIHIYIYIYIGKTWVLFSYKTQEVAFYIAKAKIKFTLFERKLIEC